MNPEPFTSEAYDSAEGWCLQCVSSNHLLFYSQDLFEKEVQKQSKILGFPMTALQSLLRNASLSQIKKTAHIVRARLESDILPHYLSNDKSLVALAQQVHYSPYLLAKMVVEEITILTKTKRDDRPTVSQALREPEKFLQDVLILQERYRCSENAAKEPSNEIGDGKHLRLAKEVRHAIESDPIYGPFHDKERHMVGIEYEVALEQELLSLNIPFETETDLRGKGTSRTPDILLSCPLGVQMPKSDGSGMEWKMISWIDSKAMFGDVQTHQSSVIPQAEAYVHRYGPGMVLYWFGHAPIERLETSQGDIVVVAWDLPEVFMWPTGEIFHRDN